MSSENLAKWESVEVVVKDGMTSWTSPSLLYKNEDSRT